MRGYQRMRVVKNIKELKNFSSRPFVTLGNFDGVHLGHRKIFDELKKRSTQANAQSVVVTFNPHPRHVLNPSLPLHLISSLEHRLKLFEEVGIDVVCMIHFDIEFSKLSADFFIRELLFKHLNFAELIVGHPYAFGNQRKGNVEMLRSLGNELGFRVDTISPFNINGEIVSSSLIRQSIQEGKLNKVSQLLGRTYSIGSHVIRGQGLGAKLGFATANLDIHSLVLPPRGVYAVEVKLNGEKRLGLANLGVRPTFEDQNPQMNMEVHILNFQGDLYGQWLEVFFLDKIRDEIRFKSPQELSGQIKRDISNVKEKYLSI